MTCNLSNIQYIYKQIKSKNTIINLSPKFKIGNTQFYIFIIKKQIYSYTTLPQLYS